MHMSNGIDFLKNLKINSIYLSGITFSVTPKHGNMSLRAYGLDLRAYHIFGVYVREGYSHTFLTPCRPDRLPA